MKPRATLVITRNSVYHHASHTNKSGFVLHNHVTNMDIPFVETENVIFDGENVIFDGEQVIAS
jgi:hypothetical protein